MLITKEFSFSMELLQISTYYSGILFMREFLIQMRAANLPPSSLPFFWRKERGKIDHSHLNETLSFE